MDGHSIQAPFAFQLYKDLQERIQRSQGIEEIEKARKIYENDNASINGLDFGAGSRITNSKTVCSIARYGISSVRDCVFIHELANIFKPRICIELGTSLGIATAYLAKSNHVEAIYTFEGNEQLVEKSNQLFGDLNIKKAQIIQGNINQNLTEILDDIDRVDLAIIDANHTEKALLHYFDLLKIKISSKGIAVIDDIRWSTEMYQGWKKLVKSHEVTLSMEFLNKGVLFFENGLRKQHYVLSF